MSGDEKLTPYPEVPAKPDLPKIEKKILQDWSKSKTFERTVALRPEESEYVFYDGPPFANGLPHHGHLLTGYVKDPGIKQCVAIESSEDLVGIVMVYRPRWKAKSNYKFLDERLSRNSG